MILAHKDTRGTYYLIQVTEENRFTGNKNWIAKAMASGPERGFVTYSKAISAFNGRWVPQERTITRIPDFVNKANRYPILEKLWNLK